jgi:formylmethanofuran dehydrogenase subunit B
MPADSEVTVRDVACTVCGCVCDDLTLTVRDNRIVRVQPGCPLAEPWFFALGEAAAVPARVHGTPESLETAIQAAADLLRQSRAPLIYGLSRSSTEGQRAAVRLADRLGSTIDTTASRCHAPSIVALQQVGESTCSLGEVRNRCDLVIFWGSNPLHSHPRHLERYSGDATGMFVPGGRRDRFLIVVDTEPTATAQQADLFLQVEPGCDFEVLWTLRALVSGLPVNGDTRSLGPTRGELETLAQRMQSCRSGIVFFGLGLTRHARGGHHVVEALLRLVTDLNRYTRFYARRMRIPGDVAGADSVLCWQTGFPFSVNLARGYPRYGPGEYSANEVLERGEVDACVIVGSESLQRLSPAALDRLRELPSIVLDYPGVICPFLPHVAFTTAIYGVHARGTAYRMDETPIPLKQFLAADLPTDGAVLRGIETALRRESTGQDPTDYGLRITDR